jgi:uncharacterized protein YjdB
MNIDRRVPVALVALVAWLAASGPASYAQTPSPTPALVRLEVLPATFTLEVGKSKFYTVTGHFEGGATQNLTQQVVYASSDPAVAAAPNEDGEKSRIDALGPGTATISATHPPTGLTSTATGDDATLTVLGPLERITIGPAEATRAVGEFLFYTATGHFQGGGTQNFTQRVDYASSDPTVALAPNEPGQKSRVEAVGPGVAVISATDPVTGLSTTQSGDDATLTVPAPPTPTPSRTPTPTSTAPTPTPTLTATPTPTATPRLESIALAPASPRLVVGQIQRFTATGRREDGSTTNLTQQVVYTSSDPAVVVAPNEPGDRSKVQAMGVGTATISAVHPATGVSSADSDGDATVTVEDGPLPTPTVTPVLDGLGDPAAAKRAAACHGQILKAAGRFVARKLGRLQQCAGGVLTCVQTRPDDGGRCLGRAGTRCARALAGIAADEQKLAATIERKCAAVSPADLLGAAGLGYQRVAAECADELDTPLDDVASVARCVVRQHECRTEQLFAAQAPRAGELLRLAGASLGLESCLDDFGGAGAGAGDPKTTGTAVDRCGRAIAKAGTRLAGRTLGGLGRCVQAVLTCVQTKPLDGGSCLARADGRCARELARIDGEVVKVLPAVAKRCGAIDFTLLRSAAGLDLDALAATCAVHGVATLDSLEAYVGCLVRRHACEVRALLEMGSPRAAEALGVVGETPPGLDCPAS